jgi:putative colanic acid biosynthesis acetyltransferase WcaF
MSSSLVDLATFDNSWYKAGRSKAVVAMWFFFGLPIIRSSINPSSSLRRFLLRLFGADVAPGVVIKPGVRVKYPWRLVIGANSWIGEDCWIDNLDQVTIGRNACLSQGAYLCTGNHDWSDSAFGLMTKPITIGDGAWIGAMSVIGPGVVLGECAVALVGSVVTSSIPPFEMHAGAPSRLTKTRRFRASEKHTSEELTWS